MLRERTNGDSGQIGDNDRGPLRDLQVQRGSADLREASLSSPALSFLEDRSRPWRVLPALQRQRQILVTAKGRVYAGYDDLQFR